VPAEDNYHLAVVHALQKEGWRIVRQQVPLRIGERRLWIDIQAEKDNSGIILVEVKSLEGNSVVEALRDAIGQYMLYRAALKYLHATPPRLILAIPEQSYNGIISEPLGNLVIQEVNVNLLVFDVDREVIVKWLP
jgi:Holliday junction resolvase-like predicted endonuclease